MAGTKERKGLLSNAYLEGFVGLCDIRGCLRLHGQGGASVCVTRWSDVLEDEFVHLDETYQLVLDHEVVQISGLDLVKFRGRDGEMKSRAC